MPRRAPIVDSEGVRHLDELLHYQIELENTPATFFLATNAVETIYMNQAGPVIFGDEDSPEVTEDTGECPKKDISDVSS